MIRRALQHTQRSPLLGCANVRYDLTGAPPTHIRHVFLGHGGIYRVIFLAEKGVYVLAHLYPLLRGAGATPAMASITIHDDEQPSMRCLLLTTHIVGGGSSPRIIQITPTSNPQTHRHKKRSNTTQRNPTIETALNHLTEYDVVAEREKKKIVSTLFLSHPPKNENQTNAIIQVWTPSIRYAQVTKFPYPATQLTLGPHQPSGLRLD